jgi:hypothetical protein
MERRPHRPPATNESRNRTPAILAYVCTVIAGFLLVGFCRDCFSWRYISEKSKPPLTPGKHHRKACLSVHKAASRVRRCDSQLRIAPDSAARFRRAQDSAGPRRIARSPSFSISQPFKPEGNAKPQPKLTQQRFASSDMHKIVPWSVMPKGKDTTKLS